MQIKKTKYPEIIVTIKCYCTQIFKMAAHSCSFSTEHLEQQVLVLLQCGKIQTLAPGATAPESRAQHPKTKIIGETF